MTDKEEPLMHLNPKTDFENLLWANNYIKQLHVEIGALKSEIDELKDIVGQTKNGQDAVKLIQELQALVLTLRKQKNIYKNDVSKLILENTQLKIKINSLENQ